METFLCSLSKMNQDIFTWHSQSENTYEDRRYLIILLGNIYNEDELRALAERYPVGSSVETLQSLLSILFSKLGPKLFSHLRGSFSLIIWDKRTATLYGVRDHFGIESFYYIEDSDNFYLSNDKQLLEPYEREEKQVNTEALQHYLTFQYVPGEMTLSTTCLKVKPGHFFMKKLGEAVESFRYFTPEITPSHMNKKDKINQIRETLRAAVKERMPANKTIGTLLSGGIDSTIITAIAKEIDPTIKTFTVGFEDAQYSEMDIAAKTARVFNLNHEKIIVTPEQFIKTATEMVYYLRSPLADPSAVPLFIAYQHLKEEVDTVLSGEGADEMFGGYEIYKEFQSLKMFRYVPSTLRKPLLNLAKKLPEGLKGKSFLYRGLTPLKDRYVGNAHIFDEEEKQQLLHHYRAEHSTHKYVEKYFNRVQDYHPMEQMQYIDWHTWMPDNILLKANRLSWAINLDVRFPFVDKKIYEIGKQLKVEEKITRKATKVLLREASEGLVPEHVLHARKKGFPVPLRNWLRKELYDWAKNNLSQAQTATYIDKEYALNLLDEHVKRKHDHSRKLWTILVFNIWHDLPAEQAGRFAK